MESLELPMLTSTLTFNLAMTFKANSDCQCLLEMHTRLKASNSLNLIAVESSFNTYAYREGEISSSQEAADPFLHLTNTHSVCRRRYTLCPSCLVITYLGHTFHCTSCPVPREVQTSNWNPEQLWKSFNHIHPQQVQNFYLKYQYRKACFFLISISAWS